MSSRCAARCNPRIAAAVRAACAAVLLTGPLANAAETRNLGDLSLEELLELRVASVYGASKYDQKVTQAPSSVSIVTGEEIRRFGHRTLADVLRSVRGLYAANDRNYTYLGIRGFHRPGDYNSRVLVTVDGHRINDNVYDSAPIDHQGMIDVELIERVEVIRGPSSSIYGSSAFFGVINVITKRAAALDGVEVSAAAGTYNTHRERAAYGTVFDNGAEWLISGSHYWSDGPRRLYFAEFDQRVSDDPRAAHDGVAVGLDGERAYNFFTHLRHGGLTLAGFYNARYKQVPTASFGTIFNDGREETADYRGYLDLKYEHSFSDRLHLQARGYYDDYRYIGRYPYDYSEPDEPFEAVMKDGAVGQWLGTEWQLTADVFDRHKVVLGAEYRENFREYQYAYDDIEPRIYYALEDRSSRVLGVYAQTETRLTSELVLTAGLRLDEYFEDFGDPLNPRLGIIYSPTSTATFKALYGEAFRAPNPFERYYNFEQANHPLLHPETIRTYELAYEQYLGQRYRFGVSAYHYDVHRLITQRAESDTAQYFENLDAVRATGIELEAEGKFDSGVLLRVSFALQRAEDANSGQELTSSPHRLAKLNLSVPVLKDRLFTSLELQYHSSSLTLDGGTADGFLLANLTVFGRELFKGLELSAGVYNLFDARYGYPGAEDHLQRVIEQNGRTVQGKLVYKF